jgi:hypothetical protein
VAPHADYSHRTTVEKLGIKAGQRVEVAGDIGAGLRTELLAALDRGFVDSGELDGVVALVESPVEADAALGTYRPRLRDDGFIWLLTRKRGHPAYLDQMQLVPPAKARDLIDNKTCSVDEGLSGIRFVVPRALRAKRRQGAR